VTVATSRRTQTSYGESGQTEPWASSSQDSRFDDSISRNAVRFHTVFSRKQDKTLAEATVGWQKLPRLCVLATFSDFGDQ
jgi:hypothetical protein